MTHYTILTIKQQILIQKLQFIHIGNDDGSKTAKIIKKVILHSITLTFRRCDVMVGNITFLMIFCGFLSVTVNTMDKLQFLVSSCLTTHVVNTRKNEYTMLAGDKVRKSTTFWLFASQQIRVGLHENVQR